MLDIRIKLLKTSTREKTLRAGREKHGSHGEKWTRGGRGLLAGLWRPDNGETSLD